MGCPRKEYGATCGTSKDPSVMHCMQKKKKATTSVRLSCALLSLSRGCGCACSPSSRTQHTTEKMLTRLLSTTSPLARRLLAPALGRDAATAAVRRADVLDGRAPGARDAAGRPRRQQVQLPAPRPGEDGQEICGAGARLDTHRRVGQSLGRLAARIAPLLAGKHKPTFQPVRDVGDHVVVVNAAYIVVPEKAMDNKKYYHHSGYPGGLKTTPLWRLFESNPTEPLRRAIFGMLPKNRLRHQRMARLRLFPQASTRRRRSSAPSKERRSAGGCQGPTARARWCSSASSRPRTPHPRRDVGPRGGASIYNNESSFLVPRPSFSAGLIYGFILRFRRGVSCARRARGGLLSLLLIG